MVGLANKSRKNKNKNLNVQEKKHEKEKKENQINQTGGRQAHTHSPSRPYNSPEFWVSK